MENLALATKLNQISWSAKITKTVIKNKFKYNLKK